MTMFADDKALYCHEDSPTNLQSKLNPDLSAITSWNFWELLEILNPFYLGISGNSWQLLGILDPCNLGISGNFCKLIGILDSFYLKIFGNIWESQTLFSLEFMGIPGNC